MENTTLPNFTSMSNSDSCQLDETFGGLFELVFYIIVFLFGVPGNCLILRVYWTKTLKSSTHVFIMALAWADLAVCVFAVYRIYDTAAFMAGYEPPVFDFIIWALGGIPVAMSVMMTAVIAADRYDCVCQPHRRFFTHRRGKMAARAAFVFSLVINIPAFITQTTWPSGQSLRLLQLAFQVLCFVVALMMIVLCYGKIYMTIRNHTKVDAKRTTPGCNVSILAGERSTRLNDSVYLQAEPNLPAVASTILGKPCSSTAADAIQMVQSKEAPVGENAPDKNREISDSHPQETKHVLVPKETESRLENGSSDPRHHRGNAGCAPQKADAANLQRKTTRMLFITSVVFLLTWLPYWVRVAAEFASYCDPGPVFKLIITKLCIILYVNNAVNPLIYGLANRRFRKDCKTALNKIKLCY